MDICEKRAVKQEQDKKGGASRKRRKKEEYLGLANRLLSMLKSSVYVERTDLVSGFGDSHTAQRLLKTLKKAGCLYVYDRKRDVYFLVDRAWELPVNADLSDMDRLALEIGWQFIDRTTAMWGSSTKDRMTGTLSKLSPGPVAFLMGCPAEPPSAEILEKVFKAWMKRTVVYMNVKGRKTRMVADSFGWSPDGWFLRGKGIPDGNPVEVNLKDVLSMDALQED